jgi:hypothetical protein
VAAIQEDAAFRLDRFLPGIPSLILHNYCLPTVSQKLNYLRAYVNLSEGAGGAYVF